MGSTATTPQHPDPPSGGQPGSKDRGDALTRVDVVLALAGILAVLALILTLLFFAGSCLTPHGV
ncbi:hypothetical protein [Mycobacterium gordonae]|uniref:Uncharacterized protein n=1 Tax=Mycobacterium gordonae TaxID=1778 RepID=A0A1X1VJU6_MYCGO|nr:hypothetical protein [Mycobacterium gordonae]MCV7009044.1 hypothetical protein [Mycobacterium gordonae]ODR24286.1 hypothetical protein BHQ23_01625 [Mycobacterium gordonae]ORV69321.1 hypothetical protein AWC08_06485 [Mycobacterium gordonae]